MLCVTLWKRTVHKKDSGGQKYLLWPVMTWMDLTHTYFLNLWPLKDSSTSAPHFSSLVSKRKSWEPWNHNGAVDWRLCGRELAPSFPPFATRVTSLSGFRPLPQRSGITRSDGSKKLYYVLINSLALLRSQCSEMLAWVTGVCCGWGGATLKIGTELEVDHAGRLLFLSPWLQCQCHVSSNSCPWFNLPGLAKAEKTKSWLGHIFQF